MLEVNTHRQGGEIIKVDLDVRVLRLLNLEYNGMV
jgi:hypothetical protein